MLKTLHDMGIQSLLVEGGAFIIRHFVEAGLWDEARRFTGVKNSAPECRIPSPVQS